MSGARLGVTETNVTNKVDTLLASLNERAKELRCLYEIEESLLDFEGDLSSIFASILKSLPPAWQYPDCCEARVIFEGKEYKSPYFFESPWKMQKEIKLRGEVVGTIEVCYTKAVWKPEESPFLKDEEKLLETIASRIGDYLQHRNLRSMFNDLRAIEEKRIALKASKWRVILDLLLRTDQELFCRIMEKLLNYLCWSGNREANALFPEMVSRTKWEAKLRSDGENRPEMRRPQLNIMEVREKICEIAERNLSDDVVLSSIQKWLQEDKASFLLKSLLDLDSSLGDNAEAVRRFIDLNPPDGVELSEAMQKGIHVLLIRRLITNQLEYIRAIKDHVAIRDFYDLIKRMVIPRRSHGVIGGKGAGIFLASRIFHSMKSKYPLLGEIRFPKTWFLPSDSCHTFMYYNNLEELIEQKYKPIEQVRREYPHLTQVFKNSHFPPDIVQGLSMALDDFGNCPLIVRSSSRLEDRFGAAFSGKYKSLFLANQGSKEERLSALLDAIAEVFASMYGPDPVEYRAEKGLIDIREEMGVVIQEVVGNRVGDYFLPAFSGLAFSRNEFRWSPRIRREDGLIRLVPGLGTRAVDRLSDDYPILVAPGHPGLRVNASPDEVIRYSPKKMDVLNLKTRGFETVEVSDFVRRFGALIPGIDQMVGVIGENQIYQKTLFNLDFEKDELVVTFDGLIQGTDFIERVRTVLLVLQEALGSPVDIEFASDGTHFYFLQCRPQSRTRESAPAPIPKDIPKKDILFTARRYVSNGHVGDITHLVYIDPDAYADTESYQDLVDIGRAVGLLNKVLPKRQFVLMGPGRWGSRGDIRLGVSVTYADISNTAVLIEIARKKGNYCPDLSFGTHFFQDLVETGIRYLPLYPDDPEVVFHEAFFRKSESVFTKLLPEYEHLKDVIRVIDLRQVADQRIMKLLMNSDLDEAVGFLCLPSTGNVRVETPEPSGESVGSADYHWQWRFGMAKRIASELDAEAFGVKGLYIFGSTKNGTAGPGSDIDLLIHVSGNSKQQELLLKWLEGWSLCLDEMNYLKTGYRSGGLLDVHLVTDEQIAARDSYASKIGAATDPAEALPLKPSPSNNKSTA